MSCPSTGVRTAKYKEGAVHPCGAQFHTLAIASGQFYLATATSVAPAGHVAGEDRRRELRPCAGNHRAFAGADQADRDGGAVDRHPVFFVFEVRTEIFVGSEESIF